jgi:hypothetical protein
MAKNNGKPLLNEGTIRRFMKLAEIGGLSDNFVGDLYEQDEEEEDLPPEGLEAGAEGELPPEPGMEEEPPLEEPGLEEPGAEMEPAPPEGGMGEEELNQFVEDVIAGVAQAAADLGVDVDVEGAAGRAGAPGEEELGGELGDELGGELGGEEEMGMGEEPPMGEEPGLEAGGEDELGGELGAEEEEELPPGNRKMYESEKLADVLDDEAIVNEVAKRVAARLIRASRAAKK